MLSPRSRIGRSAEIAAAAELGRLGYKIKASNYRCKFGEIDLIAEEDGSLVFVEVRCKRSLSFGSPAESITRAKQRKIIATAQDYLSENEFTDICCRFDVVEVTSNNGKLCVVNVIKDAFTL